MANIIPKLNLNKTPALVENNSLVFAKNIRLDVDNTIHRDYGITSIKNNDDDILDKILLDIEKSDEYSTNEEYKNKVDQIKRLQESNATWYIKHIITYTDEFYLLIIGEYIIDNTPTSLSFIICYNENTDSFTLCKCNWNYSGGDTFASKCIINLRGEKLLIIGESGANINVPLKTINLNKSTFTDDESLYTQTPNIPFINLLYYGKHQFSIPNGIYQFFVRYKIRNNFYTDWFPASNELFAYNKKVTNTSYGTVSYVETALDSDNSFIFLVDTLFSEYTKLYQGFQIGFICSRDNTTVGRAWKEFSFDVDKITFEYNGNNAEEISIEELTTPSFNIYNVKNITTYRNILYISNYKESRFNIDELQTYASNINITCNKVTSENNEKWYLGAYKLDFENQYMWVVPKEDNSDGTYVNVFTNIYGDNGKSDLETIWYYLYSNVENYLKDILKNQTKRSVVNSDKDYIYDYTENNIFIRISQTFDTEQKQIDDILNDYKRIYETWLGADIMFFDNSIDRECNNIEGDNTNTDYSNITIKAETYNSISANGIHLNRILCKNDLYENESIDDKITAICNTIKSEINKLKYIVKEFNTSTRDLGRGSILYKYDTGGSGIHRALYDNKLSILISRKLIVGYYTSSGERRIDTHDLTSEIKISYGYDADFSNDRAKDFDFSQYSVLMPHQEYQFYVHYVKQNGETTNGYLCDKLNNGIYEYTEPWYPSFDNIMYPSDYVCCFFSLVHTKNKVAYTIYNDPITSGSHKRYLGCFDYMLQYLKKTSDIKVTGTNKYDYSFGKYYPSYDTSDLRFFGSVGIIECNIANPKYIIEDYENIVNDNTDLIKCTPYIKTQTYNSDLSLTLLAYRCKVTPLDRHRTLTYYTDGNSYLYKISGAENFEFGEVSMYLGDPTNLKALTPIETTAEYIYSNLNLNCLALSDELRTAICSVYDGTKNDYTGDGKKLLLIPLPSLTMSSVYVLPDMYKKTVRKTYNRYRNDKEYFEYNNTIRRSIIAGDEEEINLYKFNIEDYYHIPTDKGRITNLVSIGNNILVHTHDSLYVFNGNDGLAASDGSKVNLEETSVFKVGITELFGSEKGFAGLQNKQEHIITEQVYMFYDNDSRIIYSYSGNNQLTKITDSIEKLIRHNPIKQVSFANDYYNNRLFISILFTENDVDYPVTLSYGFGKNENGFVSIHDFYYTASFNTKTKCYFLTNDTKDICFIDKTKLGIYGKLKISNDIIYPQSSNIKSSNEVYDSYIDVICNNSYDITKTLNYIAWTSNTIDKEFARIDNSNLRSIKMTEEVYIKTDVSQNNTTNNENDNNTEEYNSRLNIDYYYNPCKSVRVYSDTSLSKEVDCTKISNIHAITSPDHYKYPRYDNGRWLWNYFRNLENGKTINSNRYISDDNSLIKGKYFVMRFIFDTPFKLDSINFNYSTE